MADGQPFFPEQIMSKLNLLIEQKVLCEILSMILISGGGRPERAAGGRSHPQLSKPWPMCSKLSQIGTDMCLILMEQGDPKRCSLEIQTCLKGLFSGQLNMESKC